MSVFTIRSYRQKERNERKGSVRRLLKEAGLAFFQEFFQGGGAKSIVMLIFLLFSDQISEGNSPRGGKLPQRGAPGEESQMQG